MKPRLVLRRNLTPPKSKAQRVKSLTQHKEALGLDISKTPVRSLLHDAWRALGEGGATEYTDTFNCAFSYMRVGDVFRFINNRQWYVKLGPDVYADVESTIPNRVRHIHPETSIIAGTAVQRAR